MLTNHRVASLSFDYVQSVTENPKVVKDHSMLNTHARNELNAKNQNRNRFVVLRRVVLQVGMRFTK